MNSSSPEKRSGLAEVNGTRLWFEVSGTGPTLLFLHGFTLDRRMWSRQVEALSQRYRVVTYDARGFGRSALPGTEPYLHCDDAAALCQHLGLGRVIAVGHSIGAHQTLELALKRPDLVVGWVSICMAGLAGILFPSDIGTMFGDIRRAAREVGVEAARAIWRRCAWFTPARELPALARDLDEMLADYSGWHWVNDNPAKNIEPPAAERLAALKVAALVITGGRDLPYNDAIARTLLDHIPGATGLELADAGHMANMEAPEAVNDAIARFAESRGGKRP